MSKQMKRTDFNKLYSILIKGSQNKADEKEHLACTLGVVAIIKMVCISYVRSFTDILGLSINALEREKLDNLYKEIHELMCDAVGHFYEIIYRIVFDNKPKQYWFPADNTFLVDKILDYGFVGMVQRIMVYVNDSKDTYDMYALKYSDNYLSCVEKFYSENPDLQIDISNDCEKKCKRKVYELQHENRSFRNEIDELKSKLHDAEFSSRVFMWLWFVSLVVFILQCIIRS